METKGKHMADVMPEEEGLFVIPENDTPAYFIPENVYQILKWVALILLPAAALLVKTVGPQWGMPNVDAVVITIDAIGLFIGMCIGASQIAARK